MLLGLSAIATLLGCGPAPKDRVSPTELQRLLEHTPQDVVVVDVRTSLEFGGSSGHIPGAVSLPYPGTHWNAGDIPASAGQTIVLICLTGHRSRLPLAAIRAAHPGTTVVDLEGGMRAWWAADLPVTSDPGSDE